MKKYFIKNDYTKQFVNVEIVNEEKQFSFTMIYENAIAYDTPEEAIKFALDALNCKFIEKVNIIEESIYGTFTISKK